MNVLGLIREAQQKRSRLTNAQFLMAKAYRGVPYIQAKHQHCPANHDLMYRGARYLR
jgi:hypothetical protein